MPCICVHIHVCTCFPVSSSVTNATTTLDTPNKYRALHSVTVTCTINPDSAANMCEVIATADGQATLTSNDYVHMYVCTYVRTYLTI